MAIFNDGIVFLNLDLSVVFIDKGATEILECEKPDSVQPLLSLLPNPAVLDLVKRSKMKIKPKSLIFNLIGLKSQSI